MKYLFFLLKEMFKQFFRWSAIFTLVAMIIGFFLGAWADMNIVAWLKSVFIVLVLWILETSLSFDNAVVNASVLAEMSPTRQRRFLTWWIAIAVFGMRIVFPLIIVAIVGKINPIAALNLAIIDPNKYADILTSSRIVLSGFGWTFLFMVALKFFLDLEKENHWIGPIEKLLKKFGELKSAEILIALVVLFGITETLPAVDSLSFLVSWIWWVIVYSLVDWFAEILKKKKALMKNAANVWLSLFIYLEILDASFSFDGVIWAFALSKNIFIIALWLWIWAMFVRSLTIMLVRKWTLNKYIYLESGAFRAILTLAVIMFINTTHEVPEVVTWLLWAGIIWISVLASIRKNNRDKLHK